MSVEKKIKILEISGGLSTEGIGIFLLNTFENIDKDRFQLDFALATKYEQVFEERIKQQGGKIYRTFEIGEGIKGKIKHAINLYKLLNREKYQVVHSHMDFFNGLNLLVAFLARVPMRISHAHVANNKEISFLVSLYYGAMRGLIQLFSTKKLGCSSAANQFVNGNGKVLWNGIDTEKFSKNQINLPENITIDKSKKNIITVGRMDEAKNPFYILKTIQELTKKNPQVHFYWIGWGSFYEEIKKRVEQNHWEHYISILGTRNDVERFLPKMDAFILPSKYEGFGIVLAEAQAAGLKCFISENVPPEVNIGLCETIPLDKGEKYWAEKINEFLTNENKEISKVDLQKIDIRNTIITLEKEYTAS